VTFDWIQKLAELRDAGRPVAVVTVVGVSGSTPREVGAKMLVTADAFFGTIGGGHLEQLATADARRCLAEAQARTFRYPLGAKAGQCCGGVMDILVEPLNVGPRLYLFGGGHVGQAICQVLEGTPFDVHLIEERAEWSDAATLPGSVRRHLVEPDEFIAEASFDATRTYVAVMTHRHDLDQEIVAALVRKPLRFLGLIGSAAKWHRFQQRLLARGYSEAELARVSCPIGLPIGGKSPKEVAVSVASELIALHHGQAIAQRASAQALRSA
jgi:xanthine dehydrogenase accessory factor